MSTLFSSSTNHNKQARHYEFHLSFLSGFSYLVIAHSFVTTNTNLYTMSSMIAKLVVAALAAGVATAAPWTTPSSMPTTLKTMTYASTGTGVSRSVSLSTGTGVSKSVSLSTGVSSSSRTLVLSNGSTSTYKPLPTSSTVALNSTKLSSISSLNSLPTSSVRLYSSAPASIKISSSIPALPTSSVVAGNAARMSSSSLISSVSATSAAAPAATFNPATLAKELLADPEANDRWNTLFTVDGAGKQLLPQDQIQQRAVFDFNTAAPAGMGGRIILAHEDNFPILVDQGIATAVAFLNPCGMNSPHTHPRATEFLTVVQGQVTTGMMLENGFLPNPQTGALTTEITTTLNTFEGTVFPMGSIHYQFNDNCAPATFVATLNSADPGTSQIAQNFFFENERVVNITLGQPREIDGGNIAQFRSMLPANLVRAHDQCAQRCGLTV